MLFVIAPPYRRPPRHTACRLRTGREGLGIERCPSHSRVSIRAFLIQPCTRLELDLDGARLRDLMLDVTARGAPHNVIKASMFKFKPKIEETKEKWMLFVYAPYNP